MASKSRDIFEIPLAAPPPKSLVIATHHQRHQPHISHSHGHPSLYYVTAGKGMAHCHEQTFALSADTALLIPADCPHQLLDQPRQPLTVFVVYVSTQGPEQLPSFWRSWSRTTRLTRPGSWRSRQLRRLLRQMLHEQTAKLPGRHDALHLYFAEILLELYRAEKLDELPITTANSTSLQRVRKVLDTLAEKYYEGQSLTMAARLAGLSKRRFSTLCREVTGRSFARHMNHIRLEHARQRLVESDHPIAAIAFEVGFEDLSTFYRGFKKQYGSAPLAYRREHRQRAD